MVDFKGTTNKGHTLIELMVALAIVSVLILAAIPLFDSYSDDTKIDELKATILKAAASQEKHFSANGTYAASPSLLSKYAFPPVNSSNVLVANNKIKLFTGVIVQEGIGMTYWVNGSADIGNADRTCWLYVGSVLGTGDETNFLELKTATPRPYNGINCD